jgi:hypothetical protein
LNSTNYLEGNSTADCSYVVDLKQLLDDDDDYKKKYKLRFKLSNKTLSPSISIIFISNLQYYAVVYSVILNNLFCC